MDLNPEQLKGIEHVKAGHNVFITGGAGTGKSHMVKAICDLLTSTNKKFRITATTGIAANNIGGTTFHQMAGMRLATEPPNVLLAKTMKNKGVSTFWRTVDSIIVDEISMMSASYITKVDYVVRKLRGVDKPLGGIQMILVGDFYQLPPIDCGDNGEEFVFELPMWKKLNLKVVNLTSVYRQSDRKFIEMLEHVRTGDVTDEDKEYLHTLYMKEIDTKDHIIELYPTNAEVNAINDSFMKKLDTMPHTYTGIVGDHVDMNVCDLPEMPSQVLDIIKSNIVSNNPVGMEVTLKPGARVMLCYNMTLRIFGDNKEMSTKFFNGSIGTITNIVHGTPIVRFDNNAIGETYRVVPNMWSIRLAEYSTVVTFIQMPLKPAWAITVHKSQGLTLSPLRVNISKVFAPGQMYVALSRATGPDNITIQSYDKNRDILINKKVKSFYQSLQ